MAFFPVTVPLVEIYAGDTVTFPGYRIKNPDGSPIDLSVWSMWKARWRSRSSSAGKEFDVDLTQLVGGVIVVRASASQTAEMDEDGRFDVSAQRSGEVRTWVRGLTKLVPDVRG